MIEVDVHSDAAIRVEILDGSVTAARVAVVAGMTGVSPDDDSPAWVQAQMGDGEALVYPDDLGLERGVTYSVFARTQAGVRWAVEFVDFLRVT